MSEPDRLRKQIAALEARVAELEDRLMRTERIASMAIQSIPSRGGGRDSGGFQKSEGMQAGETSMNSHVRDVLSFLSICRHLNVSTVVTTQSLELMGVKFREQIAALVAELRLVNAAREMAPSENENLD